jgi:hypothetical protein
MDSCSGALMAAVLMGVITPVVNARSSCGIKPQAGFAGEVMGLRGRDYFCIYIYLEPKLNGAKRMFQG